MYDFFHGRVQHLDVAGNLSLAVAGVGYRLRISEQTRARLPLDGSETTVYARLVVRDDELLLFGFADPAERAAFDLLTGVQGIGPGHAMAVLSTFAVGELAAVLARGDAEALRRVKGIGRKGAERIALELRDKVERIPVSRLSEAERRASPAEAARDEARQALIALGFAQREVVDAIDAIVDPDLSAEDILRRALTQLR